MKKLKANVIIAFRKRLLKSRASEFRYENLAAKVLLTLQREVNMHSLRPINSDCSLLQRLNKNEHSYVQDLICVATLQRLGFLFRHFRCGIKLVKSSAIAKSQAMDYFKSKVLSQGMKGFRENLVKRRTQRSEAVKLRVTHLNNLKVKAFSSLLFTCNERKRKKELHAKTHLFATRLFFTKWVKIIQVQSDLRNRLMFFKKRWVARKQHLVI